MFKENANEFEELEFSSHHSSLDYIYYISSSLRNLNMNHMHKCENRVVDLFKNLIRFDYLCK